MTVPDAAYVEQRMRERFDLRGGYWLDVITFAIERKRVWVSTIMFNDNVITPWRPIMVYDMLTVAMLRTLPEYDWQREWYVSKKKDMEPSIILRMQIITQRGVAATIQPALVMRTK